MKKIAIQGELGSFSHMAAVAMRAKSMIVPCQRSVQVFELLKNKKVQGAVIPIENSLAGSVTEHYDLLLKYSVVITQEFNLRIKHNLIATPGAKLSQIRQVYSHPIALDQCRKFLSQHKKIQVIPYYDTAGSVQHIMDQDMFDAAAIASELAAETYGAKIIKKGIEDNKHNFTRFFFIQTQAAPIAGGNKTSIVFSLPNQPGSLFKALSVFALREIDICKIESRPVPGKPWQYNFYMDLLRGNDVTLQNALRHLGEISDFIKVMGVYRASN